MFAGTWLGPKSGGGRLRASRCRYHRAVGSPFPFRRLSPDALRCAYWDDVDRDALVHLEVEDPVNHEIEHVGGLIQIDGSHQMDVARLVDTR